MAKVSQHIRRAPKNAPVLNVGGARRVVSGGGSPPTVKVGGVKRPTSSK